MSWFRSRNQDISEDQKRPIPSDVQCSIPAATYNDSIRRKSHILSNVRHEVRFRTDMGTYPDNSISVSCCRCHQIADLPDSFPSSHAIFFQLPCDYRQFSVPFFKSFLFVLKKAFPSLFFKRRKDFCFRGTTLFHPNTMLPQLTCSAVPPCIPDALIPSITGSPASAYFTFGKRTPRSVQNTCLLSHTCRQVSENTALSLLFLFNIFTIFLFII